jgi:hypothetical protein
VLQQRVERPAVRPGGAQPAPERLRAGALLRLGQQVEQDLDLRPPVLLAGDDRQRVGAEDRQQLLVGEPEQRLQARRAQKS